MICDMHGTRQIQLVAALDGAVVFGNVIVGMPTQIAHDRGDVKARIASNVAPTSGGRSLANRSAKPPQIDARNSSLQPGASYSPTWSIAT